MAWETQGPILDRTRERLAASDRGVVMYREMLRREIDKVARNQDPINVMRDPNHAIIDTKMDESLEAGKAGSVRYHVPPPDTRAAEVSAVSKLGCSMFRPYGLLILSSAFLSLIGRAGAVETKTPWQREWDKILEGAKKEGEVRLWGEQEITIATSSRHSTKNFRLSKPSRVSGRVGDLMPRIIAERRAGNFSPTFTAAVWADDRFLISTKPACSTQLKPSCFCRKSSTASKWSERRTLLRR
jgi:hypothetical protein